MMSLGTLSAFPAYFFYTYKNRNSQHVACAYDKKERKTDKTIPQNKIRVTSGFEATDFIICTTEYSILCKQHSWDSLHGTIVSSRAAGGRVCASGKRGSSLRQNMRHWTTVMVVARLPH